MDECLNLARNGAASGEIPVGALVVSPDGKICGRGGNRVENDFDPTAHAEIVALREACALFRNHRLPECVLVTTLEPCPLCAAAIVSAHLRGVVFGASDPLCGAVVSRREYLCDAASFKIWHRGGIRGRQCAEILENFFHERRS